jgi:hypothetical protein
MIKKEINWIFDVLHRVGFQQNLGQKISDGSQLSAHDFLGHQQPQGHNKQESTTFILQYGSIIQQTALYGQGRD